MSMTHDEMIAVIQAHRDGRDIQLRWRDTGRIWITITPNPNWHFDLADYPIKPESSRSGGRVMRSRRLRQRAFLAESFENRKRYSREQRLLVRGLVLIAAVTLLGTAALIHYGSQPRTELWASWKTIEAKPSLEIRP